MATIWAKQTEAPGTNVCRDGSIDGMFGRAVGNNWRPPGWEVGINYYTTQRLTSLRRLRHALMQEGKDIFLH